MGKAYIVGIAGGSASGKSTFCAMLEQGLSGMRVRAFHMDEYFKPVERRPYTAAPISGVMYVDDNHPETADLLRLRADIRAAGDACDGIIDVIIIEGLLALYDREIYDMLDLRLFIDCRPDERIIRRIRRNMSRGLTFDEITDVYLDMVRYRHDEYVEPSRWKADLIVNGAAPLERPALIISGFIRAEVLDNRDDALGDGGGKNGA